MDLILFLPPLCMSLYPGLNYVVTMVSTWLPWLRHGYHGYDMVTTWLRHGYLGSVPLSASPLVHCSSVHVPITLSTESFTAVRAQVRLHFVMYYLEQYGYYMVTTWLLHGYYIVTTWLLHGY